MARSTPTKSNALLICHALTGDQHVANIHPVTGRPGWWETMVGPGKPFDTDRFFVICANVLGGCMGTTGPASINVETDEPYGLDFPRRDDRRHGSRAGAPRRPSRHRRLVLRRRRLDGRHAGAAMGGELSRTRVQRAADRHRRAPFLAEHRVSRSRPPGDHGRSRLARRALSDRERASRQRPRGRAHGRAHHLSLRQRAAPALRAQSAEPRSAHLLLRRGFPGRILS